MNDTIFIPNPLFEAELQVSPGVQSAVDTYAEEVVVAARILAPVDTGELQASIHMERGVGGESDVVADTPYAAYVEFGTQYADAQSFLRPAADAVLGRSVP